ncbi:MAG: peptide ABC transporter ATPase [Candidatus Bathyarchaeota archaeon B24]|nr:MAG: peptide ABC transporter ATPase [Candidatus Bathyarchaeota archaeon B24]RLI23565.1 MAG: oligopeptide ABC transporter ATP-binding protein [Candidatus Bathyarchaeota archaeon]
MPLLDIIDLKKYFEVKRGIFGSKGYVKAVDGVSLSLERGESVSIVGESGCGKTTLGKTILRLYEPTDGKIVFDGKDITHLTWKELSWYRRETGLVQQDPSGALPSFMTVKRILEEPLIIHKVKDKEERRERIYKVLEQVKLTPVEDFLEKYPHMLSGGQQQRLVIARSIILRPKLIIADEPVSMLDASVRVEILKLLQNLQRDYRLSIIYITHDLSTTRYFSERICIMYAGHIVESAETRELLTNPLHPYTRALLNVIPDPDPSNRFIIREVPAGEPPNLLNPPPGCRFSPRCRNIMNGLCDVKEPPVVEVRKGHFVKCWLYV